MKSSDTVSVLDAFAQVINSNIGNTITRKEIIAAARLLVNENISLHYIDKTRRQLTVCGYLTDTGKPGFYIATNKIPRNLTVSGLEKDYYAAFDAGWKDPQYINNSETTTKKVLECREALQNLYQQHSAEID